MRYYQSVSFRTFTELNSYGQKIEMPTTRYTRHYTIRKSICWMAVTKNSINFTPTFAIRRHTCRCWNQRTTHIISTSERQRKVGTAATELHLVGRGSQGLDFCCNGEKIFFLFLKCMKESKEEIIKFSMNSMTPPFKEREKSYEANKKEGKSFKIFLKKMKLRQKNILKNGTFAYSPQLTTGAYFFMKKKENCDFVHRFN